LAASTAEERARVLAVDNDRLSRELISAEERARVLALDNDRLSQELLESRARAQAATEERALAASNAEERARLVALDNERLSRELLESRARAEAALEERALAASNAEERARLFALDNDRLSRELLEAKSPPAKLGMLAGRLVAEEPFALAGVAVNGLVRVGAFTYMRDGGELSDCKIGRYCSIGQRVLISPGDHPIDFLSTHPFASDRSGISAGMGGLEAYARIACTRISKRTPGKGTTTIGHDVWIGSHAIVLRGVEIGHGAVIAAGSVVTKNVAPFQIVAGIPAKPIRFRFPEPVRRKLMSLAWWDYDLTALGKKRDYSDIDAMIDRLEALKERGILRPLSPRTVEFGNSS
jgi:acetyltransferase-like isoleucine patch superfamily enzyme